MIGRHFVLYARGCPKHKRQYTICNAMIPTVKEELLRYVNSSDTSDDLTIHTKDESSIYITAKTYGAKDGVATKLFENDKNLSLKMKVVSTSLPKHMVRKT